MASSEAAPAAASEVSDAPACPPPLPACDVAAAADLKPDAQQEDVPMTESAPEPEFEPSPSEPEPEPEPKPELVPEPEPEPEPKLEPEPE
eukprot:c24174_g3_i1 orf=235-504(-)